MAAYVALAASAPARAEAPPPSSPHASAPTAAEAPRPNSVRVGLSAAAAEQMLETRLRRLLELELPANVSLASSATGPLDENALRVWIDLASPTLVLVQVQAPGRRVESRRVDVSGLSWDVATRYVALAASESVRSQLTPLVRKRPRPPTAAEILAADAARSTVQTSASFVGAWLEPAGAVLVGSRLELGFHQPGIGQHVSLAALGSTEGGAWLELGVGATHRRWLTRSLRVELGGALGLAATDGIHANEREAEAGAWARASARAGLETRLSGPSWLAVRLEPGLVFEAASSELGAWLGGSVALMLDAPTSSAAPRLAASSPSARR